MKKLIDIKGRSHVFTLADGTTLRVFARKSTEVDDKLITEEIQTAQKLGLIRIDNFNAPPKNKQPKQPKSVPSNGNAGGGE